jgi:hypothetical protein
MRNLLLLCAGLILIQTAKAQNNAEVVNISAPSSVPAGQTFSAIITMKNTGLTSWTTAARYALGSESPRNNSNWVFAGRIALPAEPVNPGDAPEFTATFTAPTTPGVYNFAWGMVQDGAQWFGPIASQTIRVGNGRFTPGDLVVMQAVATGSDAISANGAAIVLNNFSRSSLNTTFVAAIPFTGPNAIVTGSSPFTGMIDLSTEGSYIVVGGYNTNLPYGASVEAATSPVPRAIGTVNSGGQFALNATTTTGFAGGTFRGAVSDGLNNFWGGGQNSGIYYFGNNLPPKQISSLGTGTGVGAIRNLTMVNGRPYFSTSQFPSPGNFGVAAFTSVAPTAPEEPVLVINSGNTVTGATGTANPKGFYINTNLTIAYVVDQRTAPNGGIYRYNGTGAGTAGSWTYAYTIANNLFANGGAFQEVVADFSGPNPKIYATAGAIATGVNAGTNLVTAIDTGAATTTFTLLATAPAGTTYRGLAFAPRPVTLSVARSGADTVIRWNGGGTLRSASNVTGEFLPVPGSPTSPYTNTAPAEIEFYGVGAP